MTLTFFPGKARLARPRHHAGALVVLVFLAAHMTARAQLRFEEDFDDPYKPWQEIVVQMPAPPQPENLVPFYVSAAATHDFMIDAKSLKVGTDGVVRYTLVSISQGGVRNVIYEGIRCGTFEEKQYAFGQPDGSWSRSRQDQWKPISGTGSNRHQSALARDYFCDVRTLAGDTEEILYRLRNRQRLTERDDVQ